jgi:hypothetical protein
MVDGDAREVVIARVVDGVASSADWDALRQLAASDAGVWAEIAEEQTLRRALEGLVDGACAVSERVALPMERAGSGSRRWTLAAGGWLAAAAIAVTALTLDTRRVNVTAPGPASSAQAGLLAPVSTAAEAFSKYLELGKASGQVLGELPTSQVIERTPRPDGQGYDVVYVRGILERTHVDEVFRTARDDSGRVLVVPTSGGTLRGGGVW